MSDLLTYKGYLGQVELDEDVGLLHGQVINTRDVITFQGRSVDELRSAFRDSIEDYLQFCKERGEEPEKPFSGRFVLRITPELHRAIVLAAAREKKGLNSWVAEHLEKDALVPA